jgi:hypothetical protein
LASRSVIAVRFPEMFFGVKDWLDKCSSILKLDPRFDYRIRYALKYSQKKGILPIGLEKLRQQNQDLYRMIDIGYGKEN